MPDMPLSLSLNEVETMAAKAARGAGLGWGQAEDLGRGSRWLAERGLAWPEPLLHLLDDAAVQAALHNTLAVADRVAGSRIGDRWITAPCAVLWALPAIAAAIHGRSFAVTLRTPKFSAHLRPDGAVSTNASCLDSAEPDPRSLDIEVLAPGCPPTLPQAITPRTRRSAVLPARWRRLEAFAARIYVPASSESRALGAGGSNLDND